MEQSYSESDVSLSPSKIFNRLQLLRQLQLMQRGKLQTHCLQYQDSPEISSSVTEIVSHFSNSTSYNTFRSLLQSSQELRAGSNSCCEAEISSQKEIDSNYIEGISELNLSQESEFIPSSPVSSTCMSNRVSKIASVLSNDASTPDKLGTSTKTDMKISQSLVKNKISLDEMPILSPKKDFEDLVIEKLKNEKNTKNKSPKAIEKMPAKSKKPFLRRGEGMARFGLQKNDLVIQNTNALPWKKTNIPVKCVKPLNNLKQKTPAEKGNMKNKPVDVEIAITIPKVISPDKKECDMLKTKVTPDVLPDVLSPKENIHNCSSHLSESNTATLNKKASLKAPVMSKEKHPLATTKGQTWASVLTKEQDTFLRQLKQSDYYKNFVSPTKSTISDTSYNGTPMKLKQDREKAEQRMFELLENKVTHESFNLNNSFFNRFLRKNNLECSGESTPQVLQKCLYDNPGLMHLHHDSNSNRSISCCDDETCSDLLENSENCSSVSTCCSCKKIEPFRVNEKEKKNYLKRDESKNVKNLKESDKCLNDTVKKEDGVTLDMADMNAKLIATSELLKDRLRELEDEIETFRKENATLAKLREELDGERQKFYEEKTIFEQKYNEEKILSEYYLAEEKEKLNKQKQIYDKYVREMRGRLTKKDKDEVVNLKKEITELKDEIRNKDAKSTSTIARLRNQIKIIEKERKTLQEEIEKLKKENRRIQHSNDITRRLTNLKYLEQINKKLTHLSSKDVHSEVGITSNQTYKAFEIERQSKIKKTLPVTNTRRRAKSVPNLNVTSRYAKYFSKKDCVSDIGPNIITHTADSDSEDNDNKDFNDSYVINEKVTNEENNLERIYNERFQSLSPSHNQESDNKNMNRRNKYNCDDGFFIQKSHTVPRSQDESSNASFSPESSANTAKSVAITSYGSLRSSNSPVNERKLSREYNTVNHQKNQRVDNRSQYPVATFSNEISGSHRTTTVMNKDVVYSDKTMIPSPEPVTSRSSISKTNLNPTEIRKSDGSRELRFPNGNVKHISADGKYSKFVYYNGDVKENFYDEGRIKYFYAETKTYHTTHADGLEVLEFSDGQVEKRYKDGSSEIRLPNGSVRYYDPKNEHVREEWRFPDGAALTVSASGEQRIVFPNGQVEVHAKDHKRREFPDGTVKLVYNDGTSETRYASGRVRIKDKHGNLIMDSAPG